MFHSFQKFNFLILIACCILLGGSFFLQYGMGYEPCPLCILSRILVILLTVFTIISLCFLTKTVVLQKISGLISCLIALSGLGVAVRHVYLQHLPKDVVPDCGPGFDYIIESFPLAEAIAMILKGSGQCSEVSLRVFGVSLAEWTAFSFLLLFLLTLVALIKKFRL